MMRAILFLLLGLVIAGLPQGMAQAPTQTLVSTGPDEMAVTVYPGDLAMITERRTIDLPAGRSRIALEGVNDRIIPQTALLTEFGAMSIERNFDYDLLTPQALLESAVGQEVNLIRTRPGSGDVTIERATIISGGQGVVFQIADRVETYQCSGLAETIQFDARPPALQSRPTLSLTVEAEETGPQTIEFRYLAKGFSWRADYIMSLERPTRAELNAWLTISNNTGIDVTEADLAVIGGTLSQLGETTASLIQPEAFLANCAPPARSGWQFQNGFEVQGDFFARQETIVVTASRIAPSVQDVAPIATREDLGDYKLYRAPYPTTLAARQTKQILFLDKPRVKYTKRYAFDFTENWMRDQLWDAFADPDEDDVLHSQTRYVIDNSRTGRLAEPLPAGNVHVMDKRGNGEPFYVGEDVIENLAISLPVEVDVGYSGEVVLIPETLSSEIVVHEKVRMVLRDEEYTFLNTTDDRVEIELGLLLELEEEILDPSIAPDETVPSTVWRFRIPANGHRTLRFKLRTWR